MTEHVTLTFVNGELEGNEIDFDEPRQFLIGRGQDCDIHLPRDLGPLDTSRHHCLLELGPEGVSVADLGSLHGTYVNGKLIGKRRDGLSAEEASPSFGQRWPLFDGDELAVGNTILRVGVHTLQLA